MSEFAGGIDEEIGVEEKEKSDKITSIEEKKPKKTAVSLLGSRGQKTEFEAEYADD